MTAGSDVAVLVVIPARGGSKGIPRKNLRALGGQPLVRYTIDAASRMRWRPEVVVTSDDAEILSVAAGLGATIHRRSASLADDAATLDEVVSGVYPDIEHATGRSYDVVVTVQPTSPLIHSSSLDAAVDRLLADPDIDTVLSAVDDTHLTWTRRDGRFTPLYEARINRQFLDPVFRESGAFIVCRPSQLLSGSRVGERVALHVVSGPEAIDIDTPEDWALAEWYLSRRDVLFVVAGNKVIGLGHVHNALTIANELVRHRIRFLATAGSNLAAAVIAERNYEVLVQAPDRDLVATILDLGPDVVINDRLDTAPDEIVPLHEAGVTVVNFEDLGPGAREADLVVNAIYPEEEALPNHHYGPDYFCLRSEFLVGPLDEVRGTVGAVLLSFGGVDPDNLTRRVLEAIHEPCVERGIEIVVIAGRGYAAFDSLRPFEGIELVRAVSDMADRIRRADVVFTSAGRTVFEVAAVGSPAIVLAQNDRELTHFFASEAHGFRNLGLGRKVSIPEIRSTFLSIVDDVELRRRMQTAMRDNDLRSGTARVVGLIEATIAREQRRGHP